MPLTALYVFNLIMYVKKNLNSFELNCQIHQINTRQKHDIHIEPRSSILASEGPYHKGAKLLNLLPPDIKAIQNSNSFKHKLKTLIYQNSIYSLDEYYHLCKKYVNKKKLDTLPAKTCIL